MTDVSENDERREKVDELGCMAEAAATNLLRAGGNLKKEGAEAFLAGIRVIANNMTRDLALLLADMIMEREECRALSIEALRERLNEFFKKAIGDVFETLPRNKSSIAKVAFFMGQANPLANAIGLQYNVETIIELTLAEVAARRAQDQTKL